VLVWLLIYLLPLGWRQLISPDEARYAVIPLEMLQTGNWSVPHLLGIEYFEKPILGYWLTAASMWLLGENNFALRLPVAMAIGLMAVSVYAAVQRATRRPLHAAVSALVLLTMVEPVVIGTTAVLDAPFGAFVTVSIACVWLAWTSGGSARVGWMLLAGGAAGAAFLTKGFLAFALPGMVCGAWLAWCGRWRDLLTLPWLAIPGVLLVAGPWAWAVHGASADFWPYFFWVEHVDRFLGAAAAQHPEPWWLFLAILPIGMIPWIFAVSFAIKGCAIRGFGSPWSKLLFCWAVLPLAFFSMSSGKLPTYILPIFAPVAALVAIGVLTCFEQRRSTMRFRHLLPGVLAGGLAISAVVLVFVLPETLVPWVDGGAWRFALLAIGLCWWAATEYAANHAVGADVRVVWNCLGPVAIFAMLPALLPTALIEAEIAPERVLMDSVRAYPDAMLLGDHKTMHVMGWLWRRPQDVLIVGGPGELAWGFETYDHDDRRLPLESLGDQVNGRDAAVVLAMSDSHRSRPMVEAMVDAGVLPRPEIKEDRGLLLAIWPAPRGE
jgi:4-amino-4-deoxy-L-arabinose transferase